MTRRQFSLLGAAAGVVVLAVVAIVLASGWRRQSPEDVALEYGRAVYANDADALWRLISEEDRRAKDEATFRRQQRDLRGFTRDAVRQLAGYITAKAVRKSVTSDRASLTLRFRLPDANAPDVRALMRDWDEDSMDKLSVADREHIAARIAELRRRGKLSTIEGDETINLVREAGAWKIFLNWAGGVRVRFAATVDPAVPIQVTVTPAEATLTPGERLRVTVRASNTAGREVTTRVGHRIEPEAQSRHLALLLCPLFVPVTLEPGESREFSSEYTLLADAPKDLRLLTVTYVFPRNSDATSRRSGGAMAWPVPHPMTRLAVTLIALPDIPALCGAQRS